MSKRYCYIVLLSISMVSCGRYVISSGSVIYNKETIANFVDSSHLVTTRIEDINKRLLSLLIKDGIEMQKSTSDSLGMSLIRHGKNKNGGRGYFIITPYQKLMNQNICILYSFKDKVVTFSYYKIPSNCTDWACARSFLVVENILLKFGRSAKE